ncbi:MAG: PorV/PorQ family protein [Elusimicrobia bacterium]|nr:PorV/PorQ family protein [Elusimicrobiota bacterium]
MIKLKIVIFFLALILVGFPYKSHSSGNSSYPFLLISPSPKAGSMGEAFVAVAEGPETVFFNPSGLGFENEKHLYFPSLIPPFVEGIKYNNIVYVQPNSKGAWAVQGGMFHVGGFKKTVADASLTDGFREIEDFSTYDLKMSVSMGQKLNRQFAFGTTMAYLRESLNDEINSAISFDVGFLYASKINPLKIGFALQHLGFKISSSQVSNHLPYLLKAGVSIRRLKNFGFPFIPENSLGAIEFFKPFESAGSLRSGIEVPLSKQFYLRSGYIYHLKKQGLGSTLSLPNGFSFGLGFFFSSWSLDYATASQGELGLTHRIAVDLKWK